MIAQTTGRRGALVAAALAFVLLVSGCSSWFQPPRLVSKPTGENVAAALDPYYSQVLTWKACGDDMQCTTATAPLDWSDPAGASISLALVRQLATGGAPLGSLLVNPGGPGASGYDLIKSNVDFAVSKTLQSKYDIVGFDPRGVGRSTPVSCYSASEFDSYNFGVSTLEHGSTAWIAEKEAAGKALGASCLANTGALLGHVDTISAARDLDLLRAALGDTTLNYLGYSYGTLLGATYAGLYPKKTGHLVLDGAIDPADTSSDGILIQAKGFESALRAFLAACPTMKGCPFPGSIDESMATVSALLDSLDASPLANTDGRQLGSSSMLTAIIEPLYSEASWPALVTLFTTVMASDPSYAFRVADAYFDRTEAGVYSSNLIEANIAINCVDYPSNDTVSAMRAEATKLNEVAPVIGRFLAYGATTCAGWPFPPTGKPAAITASGSAPIIVIGTTNDPATPYASAQALASELENGHLISYTGEGHTAYNKGNACVTDAVDAFFTNSTVPAFDPHC